MSVVELHERMAAIALQVAELHGVALADLTGKGRAPAVQWARHEAAYVCQQMTGATYAAIGAVLGGRDATTIMHSLQRVTLRAEADPDCRAALSTLLERIDAAPSTAMRARAMLQSCAHEDARLSASIVAACSVLSNDDLTDADARKAALSIMTGGANAAAKSTLHLTVKGTVQ